MLCKGLESALEMTALRSLFMGRCGVITSSSALQLVTDAAESYYQPIAGIQPHAGLRKPLGSRLYAVSSDFHRFSQMRWVIFLIVRVMGSRYSYGRIESDDNLIQSLTANLVSTMHAYEVLT